MSTTEKVLKNLGPLMLDIIKNPEEMLQKSFEDLDEVSKIVKGIPKVIDSIENGSESNLRHQLKNQMASLHKISKMLQRQALFNIVMLSGDNFKSDAAKVAIKLGYGDEALKATLQQKFKGR